MVSQSLDDHLNALNSGDPQRLGATHIELSSHLSALYSRYLHEHGWRDGWQDGALCSVTRTADGYVQCAGYSFGVTTNKNSGLNRSGHVLGSWKPVKRLSHTSCAFARRVRAKRLCPTSRAPKPLQEFHRPMLKSRSRIRIGYMYSRKENCEYCTH